MQSGSILTRFRNAMTEFSALPERNRIAGYFTGRKRPRTPLGFRKVNYPLAERARSGIVLVPSVKRQRRRYSSSSSNKPRALTNLPRFTAIPSINRLGVHGIGAEAATIIASSCSPIKRLVEYILHPSSPPLSLARALSPSFSFSLDISRLPRGAYNMIKI